MAYYGHNIKAVYLDKEIHERLKRYSKRNGFLLHRLVDNIVAQYLNEHDKPEEE